MSSKKWLFMVLCALLSVFIVWAGINVLVDPFNAFSDPLLQWDSYTQTLNPRNSKITYVSRHFDEFDSYIIGSSNAASFLPETLNKYTDASFYNMFHYGADIEYDKEVAEYLLKHDDVKNILLVIGLNEAVVKSSDDMSLTDYTHYKVSGENVLSYYWRNLFADLSYAKEKLQSRRMDSELPQAFDVFVPESGTYDKRKREVEPIGDLSEYITLHSSDFYSSGVKSTLPEINRVVENVRQISDLCKDADAKLTVVIPPVYNAQLDLYTEETLNQLFAELSSVTDYWNFSCSALSADARYFYDLTHTRNETINMVFARMFGDNQVYYPENFGQYCSKGNAVTVETLKAGSFATEESYTKTVPVLQYQHLTQSGATAFRRHMELLSANGFNPISFDDLIAFVEEGTPLPDKPVVITFDDGYSSTYELAFPVLGEYGFKATIFVIGSSVGHDKYYKDTDFELTPHFGQKEIDEMLASGLISIESHTYDMHQHAPFEKGDKVRENTLPFADESEAEYIKAFTSDIEQQRSLFEGLNLAPPYVMSFPQGEYNELANVLLKKHGYKASVTTDSQRLNTIIQGLPQSLVNLGRMSVDEGTSDEELLLYINNGQK